MMKRAKTVLVTGATGAQGGAVVDALLDAGQHVRALVRDPDSAAAASLRDRGVELHRGDFEDAASVRAATAGADGVFSMQIPAHPKDPDSERRAAATLVDAAVEADVEMFVHTSVARAGEHHRFDTTDPTVAPALYWEGKGAALEAVKSSKLGRWTVLKPAFFMDNFTFPRANHLFPQLSGGVIVSATDPDTRLDLIATADIGRAAVAAFTDPETYAGRELALAGDSLTMGEVAATIEQVTGVPVSAKHLSIDDAVAAGTPRPIAGSQRWAAVEGYKIDLIESASYGIPLQSFETWAVTHASGFRIQNRST